MRDSLKRWLTPRCGVLAALFAATLAMTWPASAQQDQQYSKWQQQMIDRYESRYPDYDPDTEWWQPADWADQGIDDPGYLGDPEWTEMGDDDWYDYRDWYDADVIDDYNGYDDYNDDDYGYGYYSDNFGLDSYDDYYDDNWYSDDSWTYGYSEPFDDRSRYDGDDGYDAYDEYWSGDSFNNWTYDYYDDDWYED